MKVRTLPVRAHRSVIYKGFTIYIYPFGSLDEPIKVGSLSREPTLIGSSREVVGLGSYNICMGDRLETR